MPHLDFLNDDYEEKKTNAQKIEEDIKVKILTKKYKTGQRIVEQDLCEIYGISRTPIREILRRIESEGLIQTIPNRGAFVKGFSRRDIDDFFTLKSMLEIQCVKWAVERITDEELETLEEIFEFMQFYTMSNDLEKMIRINKGFDTVIYAACHNSTIEAALHKYNFYLHHATAKVKYPINYLDTVLEEHRAIYEAIKNRDREAAEAASEVHMLKTMMRRK